MEEWVKETIIMLREEGCNKLADRLTEEWQAHDHEYLAVETIERLDRKNVVVLYQCALCDDERTEIQELPKSE